MSGTYRNRTWHRQHPYKNQVKSSTSQRETRQISVTMGNQPSSSSSTSSYPTAAGGVRGWDYLLRRKAEFINDRIQKAKAEECYGGTTEVFSQHVPIKQEPQSPETNEPNMYLSQLTPQYLQGMDASQNYGANEGFWIDTTGERYVETEPKQTLSRSTKAQKRNTTVGLYVKMETPFDRNGAVHSSEVTEERYGKDNTVNQLSDQALAQKRQNDITDGNCNTKQGIRSHVIGNSLSVERLISNIRNAVATNPNFKKSENDSAANQTNNVYDSSYATQQGFERNNLASHLSGQTLTQQMPNDTQDTLHATTEGSKGNRHVSVSNQTLTCNMLNSGEDVSPATKQNSEKRNKHNLASNKTLIHSLPYPAEGVEVVYTVDPVEAEAWLRNNVIDCSAQAVGFDIEWKPQFVSKKKGGVENKTAVLQLGVESSCLVLHLHNMKAPPKLLISILNDRKILKVGSGILQDVTKLKRDTGLTCKGMVDTQKMAKTMGTNSQKLGLKALSEHFLGINIEKPKTVSRSNWEKYPLTIRQIHYAALDAWIGFKLYQHMKLMNGLDQTQIEETQLVVDEIDENPAEIVSCHVLPYPAEGVEVVYTVDPVEAEMWLRNNIIDCSAEAVGFDMEWKPQFVSKKNGGRQNKTAVLQLGVERSCLVLHLHNMIAPPSLLKSILNDDNIIKVGSGISQDFKKLKRDTGLICKGMVDTQKMAKSLGAKASQKLGLKALADRFLGMNLEKPTSIARSNWENYPLTIRQIHYAALDAWIGFKLYQHMKLMNSHGQTHFEKTQVADKVVKNPVEIATCHVCKKKCKGKDALASHIKKHPQCKCGKFFQVQVSKKHKQNCPEFSDVTPQPVDKNPVEIVACRVCKKKCKEKDPLASHIKIHPQCKCGKFFVSKVSEKHKKNCAQHNPATLDDKVDENPTEVVTCHVCRKKCKGKDALDIHIKKHPQCVCGKFFQAQVSKKHKKNCPELNAATPKHVDDEVDEHPVACHVCNKECKGDDVLARHIKIHPQCECGKLFLNKVNKKHKKKCAELDPASLKHGDEVDESPAEVVTCHVCNKECQGKDVLASHIRAHPQCECGKFFLDKISKSHKKNCPELSAATPKHVDDKVDENPVEIVTCHVCNKKCKGKTALASHITKHQQCKCGKFFVAKVSKNHKKNCAILNPPLKQEPESSLRTNESNPFLLSQLTPQLHEMVALPNNYYASHKGFWMDTTEEKFEENEPKETFSGSTYDQERNKLTVGDHHMKTETPWSYPDPVESYGAVVEQRYGGNNPTIQQSDQTLDQNMQDAITDGNCDTKQGIRRNVIDNSLSVACHVCNKKVKGKDALASHIKIHAQCKCGQFFRAKVSKTHRENCPELQSVDPQDQDASDNISCCQACGKMCKNKEQLMKHIREVGHVQCPFCTRLLNGPKSTKHIKKCNEIINEEWKQVQQ
ncbi:uncharacterized protein LOC144659393 [Oculina patagonica]